jgi:hypothetical protein
MRKMMLGILPLSLAACSEPRDAANEAPISPRGGLYSITNDAGAFGMSSPVPLNDSPPRKICVRDNEGDGWIYKAVREMATKGPECRTESSGRAGNAIKGRVECQLPRSEGGGVLSLDYSGVVSEEAVDLTGKITPPQNIRADSLSEDEEAKLRLLLQVMDLSIKIRREGDC